MTNHNVHKLIFLSLSLLWVIGLSQITHAKGSQCNSQCESLNKQCSNQCSLMSGDINACQTACDKVFHDDDGYCQSNCETTDNFLTECDDQNELTEDDCQMSCENHYSLCVMTCRETHENNESKLKTCYQSCDQLLAKPDGYCKYFCATDYNFMNSCH